MKQFMAIFLGSPEAAAKMRGNTEEANKKMMQEGMEAWGKWASDYKGALVYDGSPLGKTKRVDRGGISDTKNDLGAYIVVQAETHDDAAKIFLNHPHFTIFPGDCIEVMECLPIPKMP